MKDDELKTADKLLSRITMLPAKAIALNYLFVRHGDLEFNVSEIRQRKQLYHSNLLNLSLRLLKIPVIKLKVQALNDIHEMIRSVDKEEITESDISNAKATHHSHYLYPVDRTY